MLDRILDFKVNKFTVVLVLLTLMFLGGFLTCRLFHG